MEDAIPKICNVIDMFYNDIDYITHRINIVSYLYNYDLASDPIVIGIKFASGVEDEFKKLAKFKINYKFVKQKYYYHSTLFLLIM